MVGIIGVVLDALCVCLARLVDAATRILGCPERARAPGPEHPSKLSTPSPPTHPPTHRSYDPARRPEPVIEARTRVEVNEAAPRFNFRADVSARPLP
jgi:hypothetical protein